MPASLVHYEFYKKTTKNPEPIAYLGTQGPDPFFYYGLSISPTKSAKAIRKFGTFLHEVDPYITFKYLLEYVMGSKNEEKPILRPFLKGLLAHYLLDRNAHPYIWYISGFVTDSDKNYQKYFNNHASIESSIDVLLMHHYHDQTTPFESVNYNKNELKIVSKMMYSLGKGCYKNKYIKINSYEKAIKNMRTVHKVIYSKNGKKKEFFNKYLKNNPINIMCEDQLHNIKLDFLNLKHKEWRNCITNENPTNSNFYELFDNALKEYSHIVSIFTDVLEGKTKITSIEPLFNKVNHDGFKVGAIKKYYSIIFDK